MTDKDRLAVITKAVQAFFGDDEAAKRWMNSPVRGLGDKRPVDMVYSDDNAKIVLNLISCLDHGMFL